jgi:hypothetical protein
MFVEYLLLLLLLVLLPAVVWPVCLACMYVC